MLTPHGAGVQASRHRVRARWWLAGLLVGCLLPAGLAQSDAVRLVNRVVQICWLVPETIRAESRRLARRCRWQPRRRHGADHRRRLIRIASPPPSFCAGLDVLTRRGPPAILRNFA
ncbi:hypothetical protein HIO72_14770 [Halomonas sp. PA5]|nr:hypothetical protein HIO72_14770 [Halomonas sp. PA5]